MISSDEIIPSPKVDSIVSTPLFSSITSSSVVICAFLSVRFPVSVISNKASVTVILYSLKSRTTSFSTGIEPRVLWSYSMFAPRVITPPIQHF